MDKTRAAIMNKAREKRRREVARKSRKPAPAPVAASDGQGEGVLQDLKGLTQDAIDRVGGLLKSTTRKLRDAMS